jgi:hypothetical protein
MRARTSGASEPRERRGAANGAERAAKSERSAVSLAECRGPRHSREALRLGIGRVFTTTAAIVVLGGSSSVLACPMCFGAQETSMIDGTKIGVLVLLAITLAVQGGFAGFFFYLRKRAKRNAEVELDTEWSELQKASRTS